MMKNTCFIILFTFTLICSCTSVKTLYSWDDYNMSTYNYLKSENEETEQSLIKNYNKILTEQRGTRRVVPPGIYADYGFILLRKGEVEEGNKMLEKEIELYPESKVFIDRIIKMM